MAKRIKTSLLFASLLTIFVTESALADMIDDVGQLEKPKTKSTRTPSGETNEVPISSPEASNEMDNIAGKAAAGDNSKGSARQKAKGLKGKKILSMKDRQASPVHLQSDGTSTYSQNGGVVRLEKNVVISQDDIRLQADEARVKLLSGGQEGGVQSVELNGKVNLNRYANSESERITARGDRAIFENQAQVITLEGNARLWRNGHLIKGDRIVYEIVPGLIKVDRVQGVVQPEKAKK